LLLIVANGLVPAPLPAAAVTEVVAAPPPPTFRDDDDDNVVMLVAAAGRFGRRRPPAGPEGPCLPEAKDDDDEEEEDSVVVRRGVEEKEGDWRRAAGAPAPEASLTPGSAGGVLLKAMRPLAPPPDDAPTGVDVDDDDDVPCGPLTEPLPDEVTAAAAGAFLPPDPSDGAATADFRAMAKAGPAGGPWLWTPRAAAA
jgi:hypothetical protein